MLIAVLLASLAFSVPFSYTIAANVGSYPDDSHRERSAIYVNSWAVKIRGKSTEADVVAQRNGFQNLGLVAGFSDVFHFRLNARERRGIRTDAPYISGLALDSLVDFSEQQVREQRITKSYIVPEDPLFEEQWHLLNNKGLYGQHLNDLRVEQAWLQGVTGCNVTVTVVDDGTDIEHPDLWPNFAPLVSDDNGNERTHHGTRSSGIVAAAQDDTCGVGVAFQCNLGSIKLISRYGTTDIEEATSLSYARDTIDIYSNSWGPPDGSNVMGPRTLTKITLKIGAREGRNGKGSIYVWANGNGGDEDDCAADGYASSIYTISVGAIGVDGGYSSFDEQCSAKMVVAYVTDDMGNTAIRTTDRRRDGYHMCTSTYGGTSASAPMVSGTIALALEANPNLTWRDFQYLIVYTADPHQTAGPLTRNGAGLAVSRQYGFGVMDAEAMVTRARHWINASPQIEHHITAESQEPSSNTTYSATVNFSGKIQYLEHVVVTISVAIPENTFSLTRGDLQISLESPSGTLSILLRPRPNDKAPDRYVDWPFMSVMFWGENPTGQWTLNITTRDITGVAVVSDVDFHFYGVSQVPESVTNIPDQCHSDCKRGCAGEGSNLCDSCDNLRNAYTLECINECPSGYSNRSGYCYNESLPVKECNSPLKNKTGFNDGRVGCTKAGFKECCTNANCAASPLEPSPCFCDTLCYKFEDCCDDIAEIGCPVENVTETFPYIDLGVTPGVKTNHFDFEGRSPPIKILFPLGASIESHIYVSRNGSFLLTSDGTTLDAYSGLVAPFLSVNNPSSGSISFEVHQRDTSQPLFTHVNSIINKHETTKFNGNWLLVASWENVQPYGEIYLGNTFQGILVTDFTTSSYAIFIYKCGDLEVSDPGKIGFGFTNEDGLNITHGATYRKHSYFIACLNEPNTPWVNVVYEMARSANECEANNGGCEQVCMNTFLSFNCSCDDGYDLNTDGYTCLDIDECSDPGHGCTQNCENIVGSYQCNCNTGYELNADGRTCTKETMVPEPQSQLIATIAIGAGVLLALIFCTCIIGISIAWIKIKRWTRSMFEFPDKEVPLKEIQLQLKQDQHEAEQHSQL